jgi:hypothetical protein
VVPFTLDQFSNQTLIVMTISGHTISVNRIYNKILEAQVWTEEGFSLSGFWGQL